MSYLHTIVSVLPPGHTDILSVGVEKMSVHKKIKLVRQAKGLTQEEIAEKLGMSHNAYGDIERGDSDPKLSKLEKIAIIFEMSLSELLNTSDDTLININFDHGKNKNNKNNVSIMSNSEFESQKLKLICEFQDKEIEMYKQKVHDLIKLVDALEKKLNI